MDLPTGRPNPEHVGRTLAWDWYSGTIPPNVNVHDNAYLETTFSFRCYRSRAPVGLDIGDGASAYLGTMFDVGVRGRVTLGRYALVHGARIICDDRVEIGDYALISWNVVIMDTYRLPTDPHLRRQHLEQVPRSAHRAIDRAASGAGGVAARPVNIRCNVWIGFDACILPGVTIGEGSIVGAKSVVVADVEPYTVVGGNPARIIRQLQKPPS
jgi:acetyltransferase-like isoleucine patch superfamily enzyme